MKLSMNVSNDKFVFSLLSIVPLCNKVSCYGRHSQTRISNTTITNHIPTHTHTCTIDSTNNLHDLPVWNLFSFNKKLKLVQSHGTFKSYELLTIHYCIAVSVCFFSLVLLHILTDTFLITFVETDDRANQLHANPDQMLISHVFDYLTVFVCLYI